MFRWGNRGSGPCLTLARLPQWVQLASQAPSPAHWCLPEMGEEHSRSPAPCQAKECGSYSRALGKSQDNVVDLTRGTGAEPEMLRSSQASKGDPEEGTAGARLRGGIESHPLGVLRGHGEPLAVSGTEPTLASSLTPVLPTPHLAASPTLQDPSLPLLKHL